MNTELEEKLKLEAQQHAQEARTQKAIVHEIYQALGIQKGDWNGAVPVIEEFKVLRNSLLKVSRLAADAPDFNNPLDAWDAQNIRDHVLQNRDKFAG